MDFISLEEAKKIKLDKRYCTKYVLTREMCQKLYDFVCENFKIVKDNKGSVLFAYRSIYFDTPDYQMKKDHVEHKLHRQKIRVREYESGEKFLEIKDKNNHVTNKIRVPVSSYELDGEQQWIDENLIYDTKKLSKKLDVHYYRMTLVDTQNTYRVTIDFNITFFNYITNKLYHFDDTIVEVKKMSPEDTWFETEMKARLIEVWPEFSNTKISKYNIGLEKTL